MSLLFPIRCMSCNKVIGNLGEKYENEVNLNPQTKEEREQQPQQIISFFKKYKIDRYCCRNSFMSYAPVFDELLDAMSELSIK